ncbi:hypothetical protein GCM10011613_30170 [Cellvibrio zantedeschiae]|uniref:Outer membrane protein beta-barrel domain-containing protein n=1 Tax=Cellvibrio zantedeschiae TaxID=1237077 RepID=A0ABQ3B7H5_9GAMM|nr:outer membrane beta-barrel protein [Cellvibrio zantedeschiae]GGY83250.1 hypothetical protein GCM10011613_30170 [Cellvibrio zantedeschiae]
MRKHALVLGLLAAVALPAAADGFYIYGDLGQSKFSGDTDETDTAAALGLGYKLNNNFSLELGYHDLGGIDISETMYYPGVGNVDVDGSVDASAVQVSALAKLPLNDSFDLFARLGYGRIKLDATATASAQGVTGTESDSASENKPVYGVGAGYKLNEKVGLRAEYIKFGDTDISSFTLGVSYAF